MYIHKREGYGYYIGINIGWNAVKIKKISKKYLLSWFLKKNIKKSKNIFDRNKIKKRPDIIKKSTLSKSLKDFL